MEGIEVVRLLVMVKVVSTRLEEQLGDGCVLLCRCVLMLCRGR